MLFPCKKLMLFVLLVCCAHMGVAQNTLKTPDEFLPHHLGDQFTPHHMLVDYFEYLAANAPQTMRLEKYGATNEARPLQVACFSSAENLKNLEQIRINNLRLAGLEPGRPDLSRPVVIVWISMSVHGNEASGSECSMELAWRLAAQSDPQIREWLQNTVVVLDPALNPDGYDRYSHWNRSVSNRLLSPHPETREHREPWPGGRTNHYYFDLNRDWAWATQVESRQRIELYQRWLPQVHADVHEQFIDNPYYFAPAAEPMHDYITSWQRQFQTSIGENHARYFDANGWLYFTKEVFDLFYPSYGDTYPMFNGAIGMTYEQAGNSRAGRAILTSTGDTLSLHDRILHHLTTSLSTIEVSSKNAANIVQNFRDYYAKNSEKPQGNYVSFVIRDSNDPNKINDLCQLLKRHQIRFGRAGAGTSVKAFDYTTGKETTVNVQPNDIVISAYQPRSVFVQVLFEPEARLSDSLTYDITAWALPYAHGIEAYALKTRLEPKKEYQPYKAGEIMLAASPYAWCIHRKSLAEAKFLGEALNQNLKVRYAAKPFDLADQHFEAGSLVLTRADNHDREADFDQTVKQAAAAANVQLHPIFTGWTGKGPNFGSESFALIEKPEIALLYDEETDENAFGQIWYFLEQELQYPLAAIPLSKIQRSRLHDFNTLILPNGNYAITDDRLKFIQEWVRQGGKLIALENGLRALADKDGFDLKNKPDEKKDSSKVTSRNYQSLERYGISDQLPGAIVKAKADNTHPLGYGLAEHYFSLKTSANAFQMPENATNVVWLDDKFESTGFIGSRARPRLSNTPVVAVQKMGFGEVIYLVDNPLFRCFWQQGKVLFANALFY